MSIVLMYHGVHPPGDAGGIDAEDLPYAVSSDELARQLDAVAERLSRGAGPGESNGTGGAPDLASGPAVLLTFDDGHESNAAIALPMLRERGLTAIVFVTSDFVGRRPHFCTVPMLRELVDGGLAVGAHGASHAFFGDLAPADEARELARSRAALESALGAPVRSMSFPGGRFDAAALVAARAAGFEALFGSGIGIVEPALAGRALACARNLPAPGGGTSFSAMPIERVAVRRGTDIASFRRLIEPDPAWYASARRVQRAKGLARRLLGNRVYHGLYASLRGG